ncbi:hypothetical protein SLS62_005670 [Diatrype stigma]|uniref:Uncharacterized protein n=1 Tax=Diatrype stigma TaxID=117547 RepID=A0AAN9UNR5_9PEZI
MTASEYDAKQAVEMCAILILHGADVNARNSKDETALHFPARWNNIEIPKLLLSHGADADAKDQNGKSPFRKFLVRFCESDDPQVGALEDHIQLFARFGPSPSDLIATACADGEAIKRAAGLKDAAILELLLSHGGKPSDGILRECIYNSIDRTRPRSLRLLMKHADSFRVAANRHMAFLFLIKVSRDIHGCHWYRPGADMPMETRVRTATPLPLRYPRYYNIAVDESCDILKVIWDAGFDVDTSLDENFVNFVSTYHDEFGSLVRDADQFGHPSPSPGRETISAVIFAAQHVTSAIVVLALLRANSCRDDFADEEMLEAFLRSAVYDNLEVYDGCRNTFLGQVDGDSTEGGQTRGSSDGAFECPISQELRRLAEIFPSREGQCRSDFYRAFCQAVRTEGFQRKTFAGGRTLLELAERAENQKLLDALKGGNLDKPMVHCLEQDTSG